MKKKLFLVCALLFLTAVSAFAAETTYSGICTPITVNTAGEHTIILNGVTIEAANGAGISLEAPADKLTIILKNGTENTLTGSGWDADGFAGIAVVGDAALVIRCESAGAGHECTAQCGRLTVQGGHCAAGIGGSHRQNYDGKGRNLSGSVTIEGGHIRTVGGEAGAGIGGCVVGDLSGEVIINGGEVEAIGGEGAAGIGGGAEVVSSQYGGLLTGTVTINGGRVTARSMDDKGSEGVPGSSNPTAIGNAGRGYFTGTIRITGGIVTAIAESSCAIGCDGFDETITEHTGKIIIDPAAGTAIKGEAAAGEGEAVFALDGSPYDVKTEILDLFKKNSYPSYAHFEPLPLADNSTPTPAPTPAPAPVPPQTGDGTPLALLALLAAAGMIGMAILLSRKQQA